MDTTILSSTFLLTFLLAIGLFFFIRASTKDRIEREQLVSHDDEAVLMPKLKEYFLSRSYHVAALDQEQNQVTFSGFVRPSIFLAVFLTVLALVGLICLSLVLAMIFPRFSQFFPFIAIFSPLSGVFYWQKSGRIEQVLLKLESSQNKEHPLSRITVTAHRDELMALKTAVQFQSDD